MKNIYELPTQNQRYDEASAWVAKLDDHLTDAEKKELQDWMAADSENKAVLLEMTRLWDKMTVLSRLSDLFPEPIADTAHSPRFPLALAASVAAALVAALWILSAVKPAEEIQQAPQTVAAESESVYETAVGEQSTVVLPDGTQVVLNTSSRIEVEYGDDYRLLRLERGEVHIKVAEDKLRPLSVIAGKNIVQAVGTAFSVEITSEHQIELVVTEGKVLVGVRQPPRDRTRETRPVILDSSSVIVAAGEELILGDPREEIVEVSPEEIEIKLSWREGNLIFRGESLEDAMTEIGRYTTVQFVILDDDLKRVRIAGLFKAGDVDGLLATLRENFDISYQRTEDGKILLTNL